MRAAVFRGIGQIEVTDVPTPEPGPGEVLIRVAYCGICGSDLEAFLTGMYEPGLVIGHEFAGTIAAVGPDVPLWRVGDPVVVGDLIPCWQCRSCRSGFPDACESVYMVGVTHDGGMAEYVKVPAVDLYRLPEGVSLRQGALVEPLSVALHGIRRSRLRAGDRVMVMGAGTIGLLTLQCARLAGARTLIVTEVDPVRAALAARLGATAVLDPVRENLSVALADLTDGLGPDIIFVCTGAPEPFAEAISLVRKGGQVFLMGLPIQPVETDFFSVVMGEICIDGSFAGRAETAAAIDFIAQGRVDVESLISHEIPLDEGVAEWFGRLTSPGSGAVKVLVKIAGDS